MAKMNIMKELILPILIVGAFACSVTSQDSQLDTDDSQHSLLKSLSNRYGKRPSGHSFVRFGKRAENKGHSYMYFGKKASPDDSNIADLLHYLQRSQEPSWKRGHSIMRFGKRSDRHNFIRFGKRDTTDNNMPVNEDDTDDEKRGGQHSMMYFGKRGGHSMMYFGKRGGHSMLYFGKRVPDIEDDYDKRGGHSMLYFGKRSPNMDEDLEKRGGHSMLYFGKRSPYMDDDDYEKRGGHSMLYFGKRSPYVDGNDDEEEKRGGHSMLYFGKRGPSSNNGYGKNGHSMMYFGKRDPYLYDDMNGYVDEVPEEEMNKRGPHSMIHFGKRDDDDDSGKDESNGKRAHSMIHFGKRSDDADDSLSNFTNDEEKRAGHGMIHFGKRQQTSDIIADDAWAHSISPFDLKSDEYNDLLKSDNDINLQKKDNKKSHMMIHFGKRSVGNGKITDEEQSMNSKIEEKAELDDADDSRRQKASGDKVNEQKTRTKREIESSEVPLLPFSPFISGYEGADPSEDSYSDYGYEYPLALNSIVPVRKIRSTGLPEKSKNVFLRFGKR